MRHGTTHGIGQDVGRDATHDVGDGTAQGTARDDRPVHARPAVRRTVAAVAGVVVATTLVALNAGRGRVELSLGDLILSAATGAVAAGLVVVALTVRDELARPRGL